jgi:hypothetical protein
MPGEQRPLGHRRRNGGIGGPGGVGDDHRALPAKARDGVTVLRRVAAGGAREGPDAHDWLEVTELTLPEPEPVDVLVAPELVEPVESDDPLEVAEPADPVEVEVVAPLVVPAVAAWVTVLRASAGSCPVTSTTVMSIHTAKKRATDPPITRARILRTRARRTSLSLMPSSLVMVRRLGQRHRSSV